MLICAKKTCSATVNDISYAHRKFVTDDSDYNNNRRKRISQELWRVCGFNRPWHQFNAKTLNFNVVVMIDLINLFSEVELVERDIMSRWKRMRSCLDERASLAVESELKMGLIYHKLGDEWNITFYWIIGIKLNYTSVNYRATLPYITLFLRKFYYKVALV